MMNCGKSSSLERISLPGGLLIVPLSTLFVAGQRVGKAKYNAQLINFKYQKRLTSS
jgi:hypothetical protein